MTEFNEFMETVQSWPVGAQIAFAVLALVSVTLQLWAFSRVLLTPDDRLVFGKKWPWLLITLFANPFGAIITLAMARKSPHAADPLAEGASAGVPKDRASRAADVLYGPKDGSER